MVSQGVACLRVGPVMVAFGVHSMTALLRNMGTLQPLGVTALCSCARCRLLVPSSMWVHARMELRSGAVFPPQFPAVQHCGSGCTKTGVSAGPPEAGE